MDESTKVCPLLDFEVRNSLPGAFLWGYFLSGRPHQGSNMVDSCVVNMTMLYGVIYHKL